MEMKTEVDDMADAPKSFTRSPSSNWSPLKKYVFSVFFGHHIVDLLDSQRIEKTEQRRSGGAGLLVFFFFDDWSGGGRRGTIRRRTPPHGNNSLI